MSESPYPYQADPEPDTEPFSSPQSAPTMVLPAIKRDAPPVNNLRYDELDFSTDPEATVILPRIAPTAQLLGTDIARLHMDYAKNQASQVAGLRKSFASLSDWQRSSLEPYLQHTADKVYDQDETLRPDKGALLWSEWLGSYATTADLKAFSDAHTAELEERTADPRIAEAFATVKNTYIQKIDPWIAKGWFSPHLATQVKRLQAAKFQVGDAWDTILDNMVAYHMPGTDVVTFGQGTVGPDKDPADSMVESVLDSGGHELDHIVNGHHMPEVFMEICAEHIALSMQNEREFHVFDPRQRSEQISSYINYRILMGVIAEEGDVPIPAEVWTRAHTAAGADSVEYRELVALCKRAWGVTPEAIDLGVRQYEDEIYAEHPDMRKKSVEKRAVAQMIKDLRALRDKRRLAQADTVQFPVVPPRKRLI